MLSYFYSDLKTKDQKTVAKEYQANYRYMRSWLRCCTDIRNICAHYGRLYYRIFPAIPAGLDIPESGKRRLWGAMLVIKALYPSKNTWDDEIVLRLEKLFKMYAEEIELYHIAFPENWFDILSK
jgi:abortive infection bacteriophage resistance protein